MGTDGFFWRFYRPKEFCLYLCPGASPETPTSQNLPKMCLTKVLHLTVTSSVTVPGRGQLCVEPQIVDRLLISLAVPLNLSCRLAELQLH